MAEVFAFIILVCAGAIVFGIVFFIKWCRKTVQKIKEYPKLREELSEIRHINWEQTREIEKLKSNQYSYDVSKLRADLKKVTAERDHYKALVDQFAIDQPDFQKLENLKKQLQQVTYDLGHIQSELQRYSELLDTQRRTHNNLTLLNDLGKPFSHEIHTIFRNEYNISLFYDAISNGELNKAFEKKIQFRNFDFSAIIVSENKEYRVSLRSCTCEHYQFNCKQKGFPCKHMVCFAYTLGLLQGFHEECHRHTTATIEQLNQLSEEVDIKSLELKRLETACIKAEKEKKKLQGDLKELRAKIKSERQRIAQSPAVKTEQ